MTDQRRAYGYGLAAVLLWSTVATAFKIALRYLTCIELLLYASIASTAALLVVLVASGQLGWLWRQSPGEYLRSALLGALNPFLYYMVLFQAYSRLPAQQAQPLNYTWPMLLVLLSLPFLRQRIPGRSILAVLISFFGVVIISTRGDFTTLRLTDPLGVALALGSGLIWALYWIFNLKDPRDAVLKLCLNFLFGLVYILAAYLAFQTRRLPSLEGLAAAAYVGLFEMGITFVVWLKALKLSATTAQVSILVYLSPFCSLVFIQFILRETILLSTVIGLVLIVGGILYQAVYVPSPGGRGSG